jgi:hypothetical protein
MIRSGFLTLEQRASLLRRVHRTSEPHGAARRANAMLLLDDGLSCEAIAKVFYIDDDTVRGWYERWGAGGETALSAFDFKGAKRTLSPDRKASSSRPWASGCTTSST